MEELNISELFQYLKAHIIYYLLIFVSIVFLGIVYTLIFQKAEFTSSTSLILAGVGTSEDKITTNDITLNSKMVSTYQEIIKSKKVLNQVISNLYLSKSAAEIATNITVRSVTDSVVLKIDVVDTDSNRAKDIANEVAIVFSKEIKDLYNISNVSILDKAEASVNSSSSSFIKQLIVYFAAGIFVSTAVLLIIFFFDKRIKSVEQVEGKFGITLLGSIPDYFSKKQKKANGGRR